MGAILTATSIPGTFLPEVLFADKVVHVVMYGVLGFLVTRAMDDPKKTTRLRAMLGVRAFLFCVAIGAIDEWHQKYIQGRKAGVADWVSDSAGGLFGAATWVLRSRQKDARID